jgi:spoIIIJ-associated protein
VSDDVKTSRNSDLDGVQGADEQRTEEYKDSTSKEQSEYATKQSAKSAAGVDGSAGKQGSAVRDSGNTNLEEAILFAKRYLEDLLSFFGLNTDVRATSEDEEVIELKIPSTHLNGFLIGSRGDNVRAIQYIISSALKAKGFSHTRINVDVADYKKNRADRLAQQAEEWFKQVRDSGEPKSLPPMNPADRRTVHKAANDYGLDTHSEGEGRDRHIVIRPAGEPAGNDSEKPAEKPEESEDTAEADIDD